jgi:predicted lysophospholipase L1 biosynthesis ABC-type transport system permease subunit
MIRLAWSRLRYRPVRGLETVLLAALLGALAAPSKLFLLACVLYLPATLVLGGVRTELRTLATLGWPWRHLAGAVLAEYAMIGLAGAAVAAIVAAALTALQTASGDTAGAGPAAAVAFAAALAAGVVRAATAAELLPNAERSRPS